MKNFQLLLSLLLTISLGVAIQAQNSREKTVQGFLNDGNGKAVPDGEYDITFIIYNAASGGQALWQAVKSVNVTGGVYSTLLGAGTLPPNNTASKEIADISWANNNFLAVKIQGIELNPRTPFTYSPYALAVNTANYADSSDYAMKADTANFARAVECTGAVGDIKYSILDPTRFAEVNGDCWVPMDGQANLGGTPLKVLLDQMPNGAIGNQVPDVSGAFIRAHEYGSTDRDPDRTTSATIATLQDDLIKNHTHQTTINDWFANTSSRGYAGSNDYTMQRVDSTSEASESYDSANPSSGAGSETRPKNFNFYAYIRIN